MELALRRVAAWSVQIHGRHSPRHLWVLAVARALLDCREPPPPPGRWMPGTVERRMETIRRLLEEA